MILAIYKPKGPSSNQLLNQIRKITAVKKIGHTGTLDPLASGVLVIGIGNSTKRLGELIKKEKEYLADIKLGVESSTGDDEGEKKKIDFSRIPSLTKIKKELKNFEGEIYQTPPIYSAIKVKGERAYKLARKGENPELKPRKVEIKKNKLIKYDWPFLRLKVVTGPGVYIRSLAKNLGQALKTGGYLVDLERTRVGNFTKKEAIKVSSKEEIISGILKNGGIGILPTDTIYGLVGQALSQKTVQRIYECKKRNPLKPMIILVSSRKDLKLFDIKIDDKIRKLFNRFWPGKFSIVLPCLDNKFSYLHRGAKSLAFRQPKKVNLIKILKKTGPLVAPSANPEGLKPAKTIEEAKKYFGYSVDFYLDEGSLDSPSSTLITIKDGKPILLRGESSKLFRRDQ